MEMTKSSTTETIKTEKLLDLGASVGIVVSGETVNALMNSDDMNMLQATIMSCLFEFCKNTGNLKLSFEIDPSNGTVFMQTFGTDKLDTCSMVQVPIDKFSSVWKRLMK